MSLQKCLLVGQIFVFYSDANAYNLHNKELFAMTHKSSSTRIQLNEVVFCSTFGAALMPKLTTYAMRSSHRRIYDLTTFSINYLLLLSFDLYSRNWIPNAYLFTTVPSDGVVTENKISQSQILFCRCANKSREPLNLQHR